MEILRIRTGFTTNSSAAAEWAHLVNDNPVEAKASPQAHTPAARADAASLTAAKQIQASAPTLAKTSQAVSNSLVLFGVVGVVAGAFIIERGIRIILKRLRSSGND